MFIIGERINSTRKPIREALERKDAEFFRKEAKAQADAGAGAIDLNAAGLVGQENKLLPWLIDVVQDVVSTPLCIDTPSAKAARIGLKKVKTRPVFLNSISAEKQRYTDFLPLVKEFDARVVALCADDGKGMARSAEDKLAIAERLLNQLADEGVPLENVYVDPLVFPVSTDSRSGKALLDAIRGIMTKFPMAHTTVGLSNASYGLPQRKLINGTLLAMAVGAGLDAAILDPLDPVIMATVFAAEAVIGRDDYCAGYIGAFREGRLGGGPSAS